MLVIKMAGKAEEVFKILDCLDKNHPEKTIGQIIKESNHDNDNRN